MSAIHVSQHPLVLARLALLRDKSTPAPEFRRLVRAMAQGLAIEATSDLATRPISVATPLGHAQGVTLDSQVVIVPILRAGLGMAEGVLELIPEARVCHLGMFRDETTLRPTTYYQHLIQATAGSTALVVDPMLATGGSAEAACRLVAQAGFTNIKFIALLAAPEGISVLQAAFPNVPIHVAAIDERLTDVGFIFPGLGDAGDRQFGTQA